MREKAGTFVLKIREGQGRGKWQSRTLNSGPLAAAKAPAQTTLPPQPTAPPWPVLPVGGTSIGKKLLCLAYFGTVKIYWFLG